MVDSAPPRAWFGPSIEGALWSVSIAYCEAHPDYPWRAGTDIAYCELAEGVTQVTPARLASSCAHAAREAQGAALVLRAHGYTTAARREARVEREVEVRIEALQAEERELVVGDRAHGACNGDSGGSAYVRGVDGGLELLGVISRRGPSLDGQAAEDCASTTIVTRVAPHRSWLAERTAAVSACGDARSDVWEDPWLDDPSAEELRAGASTHGCAVDTQPADQTPPWALLLGLIVLRSLARCRRSRRPMPAARDSLALEPESGNQGLWHVNAQGAPSRGGTRHETLAFGPQLQRNGGSGRFRRAAPWRPRVSTDKRKQSLYFPEVMLTDLQREADRLERSLSWVVQRCVRAGLPTLGKQPSTQEPSSPADPDADR